MTPLRSMAIACLLATGCRTTPPIIAHIKIDSEPPGARIFVGMGALDDAAKKSRSYIGITPMVWDCQLTDDGEFDVPTILVYSRFAHPVTVFYADPPANATNQFEQHQAFRSATFGTAADKVPQGVFFDMFKKPAPPAEPKPDAKPK